VSAKFMLERELTGLRYSYEEAVPIIEDLDPFGWGGTWLPAAGKGAANLAARRKNLSALKTFVTIKSRNIPVSPCVRSVAPLT
jgi:hypothetical protein